MNTLGLGLGRVQRRTRECWARNLDLDLNAVDLDRDVSHTLVGGYLGLGLGLVGFGSKVGSAHLCWLPIAGHRPRGYSLGVGWDEGCE